tara:strand:+ start:1662 stop:1943 length:282 start_codon:yes stop_codon:yes gene_type:complete
MLRFSSKLLVVWLLSLSLLGVQLVQHSALHDHTQHVVDCALCHFDNHGHALPLANIAPDFGKTDTEKVSYQQSFTLSLQYNPYQGRSPPTFFI